MPPSAPNAARLGPIGPRPGSAVSEGLLGRKQLEVPSGQPMPTKASLLLHVNDRLGGATARVIDLTHNLRELNRRVFGSDGASGAAASETDAPVSQGHEATLRLGVLHDAITAAEQELAVLMGAL